MRIGSFNVENLFDRAKALNMATWQQGAPVLAAHAELNGLFQRQTYTDADKTRMLELLDQVGLLRADSNQLIRLRKIRGQLLTRRRNGTVEIVADGRAAWIGWVELATEPVDDLARVHTARVIQDVAADVLGVVEADSRPVLDTFSGRMLASLGAVPYQQTMLIDGNDDRGIDVGVLTRHPITAIRSHIYDHDAQGRVFSRDCCEYHLDIGRDQPLVLLVNHFKSKGYASPGDPTGAKRRRRQATRVAEIYNQLTANGHQYIAVVGDLNDHPNSTALKPLLQDTTLTDISTHPAFQPGERTGTFLSGGDTDKIDYVLLSPSLYAHATGGGIYRKGVWRGPRTRNPWPIYDTLTADQHAASDHAAIYADITLP